MTIVTHSVQLELLRRYTTLLVFGLVAASAVVWFDAGAVVTCMRNFPSERGTVAGKTAIHIDPRLLVG